MKRTILTITQQNTWCQQNHTALTHKWSCRGYGNSKMLHCDTVIAKASGCGFDRFGTVLGDAIEHLFGGALTTLASKECRKPYGSFGGDHKASDALYGLFYDADKKRGYVDGGCGHDCMRRILNRIGFSLEYVGETGGSVTGEQFYQLTPLSQRDREFLR